MLQSFLKWFSFWGIGPCIAFHPKCYLYKKEERGSTCTLILEMWHDCIIFTTYLLYSFNQGDIHQSFILFNNETVKIKVYRCSGKCAWYRSWLGPFSKPLVSGALYILTLRACISGVWWTIFNCKVCASKLKIDKFSCLLRELWYLIVLFLLPVKSRYFFWDTQWYRLIKEELSE